MSEKYYFLNTNFNYKRTGIENAALLRIKLFEKYLNIKPYVLTALYNENSIAIQAELHSKGLLSPETKIMNMYNFFQETDIELLKIRKLKKNPIWSYESIKGTNDIRVKNEFGKRIEYHVRNEEGRTKYINFFNKNDKKIRREWFDSNGYLSKTEILNPLNEKVFMQIFFRKDGTPCIYKYFSNEETPKITDIQLVDETNTTYFTCYSEEELINYWLQQVFDEEHTHVCLIDRNLLYYPILKNWQRKNVKIISLFHSTHFRIGHNYVDGELKSTYREVLNDLGRPEAVVYLTEKQKEHVAERFGEFDNQYVIPHALETLPARVPFEERVPLSVAYLARFAEEKQPLAAIRIFAKVVHEIKDAKLHLYGHGNQRTNMLKLIDELNLKNNIFVHDFVDHVSNVYNRVQLGLLTSKVEGFSLFTLECIAHGVPVVSYDINYGPSDMIKTNKNGMLCTLNNEEEMAQQIIELLSNQELLKQMSENAYEEAKKFDGASISEKWSKLIGKLRES